MNAVCTLQVIKLTPQLDFRPRYEVRILIYFISDIASVCSTRTKLS
jgi:hypothetical protein